MPGLGAGLVVTAFVFGFRHGIDWDHLAAITDITGSRQEPRPSMYLATLYALGHALVVFVLGMVAVLAGELLPSGVDAVMQRVVGATLILLGIYVFYGLVRYGKDFRFQSRWMLVLSSARRGIEWIRARGSFDTTEVVFEHEHEHPLEVSHDDHPLDVVPAPDEARLMHRHTHTHQGVLASDPFTTYGSRTAFGIGMLHGIGAETPTQLLLFVAAAGAAGKLGGTLLLVAFIVGLLVSNTLIALAATLGFLRAGRSFRVYAGVGVVAGGFSLVIGAFLLTGRGSSLPAIFGG